MFGEKAFNGMHTKLVNRQNFIEWCIRQNEETYKPQCDKCNNCSLWLIGVPRPAERAIQIKL